MAVLIEAVCAVVRRDAIDARIAGGWAAFTAAVPTGAFCYDDELASVGFMAVADAETFLAHLQSLGLRTSPGAAGGDACIVEQLGRSGAPAAWLGMTRLTLDEIDGEVSMAYLRGTRESRVVMPGGWKFEGSVSQTPMELREIDGGQLKFLRHQDNIEVYWDNTLQREVYVGRPYGSQPAGRPALSDAQRDEHNRLWNAARDIVEAEQLYARVPPFKPGFFLARKMRKAIVLLEQALALHPTNAAALWMQGKLLQLLGDFDASLDRLAKACLIDPNQASFAREAGISATEAGKLDVAVFYAQEALKATPGDAGCAPTSPSRICLPATWPPPRSRSAMPAPPSPTTRSRVRSGCWCARWPPAACAGPPAPATSMPTRCARRSPAADAPMSSRG